MSLNEDLKWRYATKQFDASKKVSDNDIQTIKEAINLAATSYGLQLFNVIDVQNEEIREKLKAVSYDQPQITDASHLFVFANYTSYKESQVDEFINLKSKLNNHDASVLKGFSDYMKGTISKFPEEQYQIWTTKQTYIALGNGLASCAELKIDSTPMEGFVAAEYNNILGLTEKGLSAAVVLAIGYRSEKDDLQHAVKTRKPLNELFIEV